MRAAIYSFFFLCLLLSSGALLPEAGASGLNSPGSANRGSLPEQRNFAVLKAGTICLEQNAILLHNSTEQQLQEEVRSCFKGSSAGKGEKSFRLSEAVSLNKVLLKEHLNSFTGAVPIWLKVLSLRL